MSKTLLHIYVSLTSRTGLYTETKEFNNVRETPQFFVTNSHTRFRKDVLRVPEALMYGDTFVRMRVLTTPEDAEHDVAKCVERIEERLQKLESNVSSMRQHMNNRKAVKF